MTNYTQSTNFATKDALTSGNPLKIVKGTELNTEFANIAIAVATKADLASPAFTGTPSLPTGTTGVTQSFGTSSTLLATTAFVQAAFQILHPVGSIYINATSSTNPGTLLGFGTWTAFGAGRVLVGFSSANALFGTAEETGGSADAIIPFHTHTATSTDAGHNHSMGRVAGGSGSLQFTSASGMADISPNTGTASASITTTIANATSTNWQGDATVTNINNANYQPYITVYMWKRTA